MNWAYREFDFNEKYLFLIRYNLPHKDRLLIIKQTLYMNKDLLLEVIENIKLVKIAVIGDFCLDAYFFIDNSKSEISVETGLPTRTVKDQSYSLGGAGNLANNIISLGAKEVRAIGVIGNDLFGREMVSIMKEADISTRGLLTQDEQWSTHVYCKPYDNDIEQNRFDFGNFNVLDNKTADKIIANLSEGIDEVDVVIINQQVESGIHTDYFKQKLQELIHQNPDKIFISDIRDSSSFYDGCYIKINDLEAASFCGFNKPADESVSYDEAGRAAEILFEKTGKPVFVTCGSKGSMAIDSSKRVKVPVLMHPGRIDTVGAGDSYLAGASVSLAAGYDIRISAEVGSFVAGVTVRKLFQTGTATPEELIEIGTDPDFIFEPELAEDIRKAQYIEGSDTEIIKKWPENLQISHAIFDHDGTISTLREGWELIMAPMMIKAILGNKLGSADKSLYDKVAKSVDELIDRTTGIQTLAQMAALIELVKDFGIVPADDILDIYGYKKIYNEELLKLVHSREQKIRNGELGMEDFTMKNSVAFVEKLYKAGVKLYLASGTDQDDVRHEAAIFGYDKYFEGSIYGSVGDINKEAKKIVLDKILNDIGDSNYSNIVTFGDGPVEIRETLKKRGLTVGVASNEVKRFSLNKSKRTRLIKAGADVIVPDFTQQHQLLSLLNIH